MFQHHFVHVTLYTLNCTAYTHPPLTIILQLNAAPRDIPDMYSKPGTACNDYTGYCDVFQKCREVRNSSSKTQL